MRNIISVMLVSRMFIGMLFTLLVVPSVILLVARTRVVPIACPSGRSPQWTSSRWSPRCGGFVRRSGVCSSWRRGECVR